MESVQVVLNATSTGKAWRQNTIESVFCLTVGPKNLLFF